MVMTIGFVTMGAMMLNARGSWTRRYLNSLSHFYAPFK